MYCNVLQYGVWKADSIMDFCSCGIYLFPNMDSTSKYFGRTFNTSEGRRFLSCLTRRQGRNTNQLFWLVVKWFNRYNWRSMTKFMWNTVQRNQRKILFNAYLEAGDEHPGFRLMKIRLCTWTIPWQGLPTGTYHRQVWVNLTVKVPIDIGITFVLQWIENLKGVKYLKFGQFSVCCELFTRDIGVVWNFSTTWNWKE